MIGKALHFFLPRCWQCLSTIWPWQETIQSGRPTHWGCRVNRRETE